MSKVMHTGEFFVVGGPVQWDRPSYVERAADDELYEALKEGEFCYVLESRASGKSSLMGRTVRRLRDDGRLAAVVDLTQIGAREQDAVAGRWYYSIAYRIVRELRLKVDLQGWWQEKNTLTGEQRLSEFFWEIVLANSTAPICIFIDEIELTIGAPYAQELFASIKACYNARIGEPDYGRLNFVLLGVASPRQLCPDRNSPFENGRRIPLSDFTVEEIHQLAPGFGVDLDQARQQLGRIFHWTAGQPYLTQKLARQVARADAGEANDELVDRLVRDRFLAPAANRDEALLNHIRTLLTTRSSHMRKWLTLLGRISKGVPSASDPESPAQDLLRLSGLVIETNDGQLALRNRIYQQVFSARWVNTVLPFEWRAFAVTAGVAALLVLIPVWYFQFLPRPYIRALSQGAEDVPAVISAYDSLRALPGFANTAQQLLANVMGQHSQRATSYSDVSDADMALRRIPGFGARADALLAQYWLRRAQTAAAGEDRDDAVAYALAGLDSFADGAGRSLFAELIDDDYQLLTQTIRVPGTVGSWAVDWETSRLTVVDQAHRVFRYALNDVAPTQVGRLTALQSIPVSRDLAVDETGSVGRFELVLDLVHPAPEQLRLVLHSPDGATARLSLVDRPIRRSGRLRIRSQGTPLSGLADEGREGVWRLDLVDETEGATGQLARWSLSFSNEGEIWTDTPESGLAIPDPIRTNELQVRLSDNGTVAAAIPTRADGVGALTLWDVTRAVPVARIATQLGFALPPARSPDGAYLAIAEILDDTTALFSLLRTVNGRLVASYEGSSQAGAWSLGPDASYLVVNDSERLIRVFDPRRPRLLATLPHSERVEALVTLSADQGLITADSRGVIRHWELPTEGRPEARSTRLGITRATASLAANAHRLAYQASGYSVTVGALASTAGAVLRGGYADPLELALSTDGERLVSRSGSVLRVWQLPSGGDLSGWAPPVASLALDAAGDQAVIGDWDGHLRVLSSAGLPAALSGEPLGLEYIGHNGPITALAMDSRRALAASGGSDGVVRLWDLVSGAPTAPFLRHPQGPINGLSLSGDGRWVASAAEYAARIWQVSDGQLHGEIPVDGAALAVAFSPDSKLMATGDSAGNILIADTGTLTELRALRASGPVQALAVAPSGDTLASGTAAGSVALWHLGDDSPVAVPVSFTSPIRSLSFSGDGAYLLVHTATWYHRLSLTGPQPVLEQSRLAPLGAAAQVAHMDASGRKLRVLAAGRQLLFHDLDMARAERVAMEEDFSLDSIRWRRAVGLTVGESGDALPLPEPAPMGADGDSVN